MTDTRFFKTTAINRVTGEWKNFYHISSKYHRVAARAWLLAQEKKS